MAVSPKKSPGNVDAQFYLPAKAFFESHAGYGLTYDDVSLATLHSDVLPRQTRLDTSLSDSLNLSLPVVSSDMDTVTEHQMAIAMALNGGLGLLHYNMSDADQLREVQRVKNHIHGMIADPATVSGDATIGDVLARIERDGLSFSTFPVVGKDGRLLGLLPGNAVKERHRARTVAAAMIPLEKVLALSEKDLGKDPIATADRIFSERVGLNKLLVVDAKGRQRMVNAVLPKLAVDFVSYSAYDCQLLSAEEVRATLDYVNAQLPPKAGLPAKRVFIGECGLSWKACGGDGAKHEQRNREILTKFLSWKPAMVLFWQYYNNEVVDGEQVGFWLVDNKNKPTPLHATMTALFAAQEEAARELRYKTRRLPGFEEMAAFSENWLTAGAAR